MDSCCIILSNTCRMQSFVVHLFAARKSTLCDRLYECLFFFLFFWCVLLKKAFGHWCSFFSLENPPFVSLFYYHLKVKLNWCLSFAARKLYMVETIRSYFSAYPACISTFIFLDSIVQALLFGQYSFLYDMLFRKRKREMAIFLSK